MFANLVLGTLDVGEIWYCRDGSTEELESSGLGLKFLTLASAPTCLPFYGLNIWLGSGRLPGLPGRARITSGALHFVSRFLPSPAPP